MKIAIINDIHSNARALERVSQDLSGQSLDHLVVLGDVLSYGVSVNETLQLLDDLTERFDSTFIKGNHDQIYFDLQAGREYQYKPFPDFINESVLFTGKQMDAVLEQRYPWRESIEFDGIFLAHANAFEYANWSYLNTEQEFADNLTRLKEKGVKGGIFGHSHRAKYRLSDDAGQLADVELLPRDLTVDAGQTFAATNGSLGQPRGMAASYLLLETGEAGTRLQSIELDYDVAAHCKEIAESTLSEATKARLLGYYEEHK